MQWCILRCTVCGNRVFNVVCDCPSVMCSVLPILNKVKFAIIYNSKLFIIDSVLPALVMGDTWFRTLLIKIIFWSLSVTSAPWAPSDGLFAGNCGKATEVKRSKKSQSKEELRRSRDNLNEEGQSLLDSEDELDREEVLNLEPENRSVTVAMRSEPTEYDR